MDILSLIIAVIALAVVAYLVIDTIIRIARAPQKQDSNQPHETYMPWRAPYAVSSDVVSSKEAEKRSKADELREQRAKAKEELNAQIAELAKRFGNCSVDINLGGWTDHTLTKRLLVFEESKIIIINESKYKFSDILGFSMIDDSTKETTTFSDGGSNTSTGSMIGRAIVGGVVGGGLGAVAGATTAKRNDSSTSFSEAKTKHRYAIYINLNSFENPTLKLSVIEGSDRAYKIANILNVIIERNKQN